MLLVCRFAPDGDEGFPARARRAVALLAAQPGCEGVELARAIEEPGRWVLVARFATVTAYRRALQPFDVREHVVPFLSEALTDEPGTYERGLVAGPDGVTEHPSLLTDRAGGPPPGA
ncbi:antibiotic biosynthesis monooxygenase [Actinomycetospora cinnamomea]|uniref:Antibiotic biosynthesis monooxygenase n=1 Tax=Actinomycetospora cinnamomea TaxID=663609 RepID=A0A2U1F0V7_9PSEU|nr:antibiotic biosynthesis monooxygenase [Actinomycetospora cinnamomea]PVZ05792.1 antibiotic biosynthesis monooxygenase [Actinomycetospora cinnamomea]